MSAVAPADDSGSKRPPPDPAITDEMRADMAAGEERWAAAQARRTDPEARRARVRSRSAHAGLGPAAALELARNELGEVFGRPAFVKPGPAGRVKRFISDFVALFETPDGKMLVESTGAPLASAVGSGERELLDLTLEESPEGFVPRNPAAALRIARSGRTVFPDTGLGVNLAGMNDAAEATATDGRLFFANAVRDTDMVITPTAVGVSFAFQVRSAAAPEEAVLDVELPAGARLREAENVQGGIEVVRGGDVLARVLPPAAWDADGTPFAVDYDVEGSQLVVAFPHADKDLHYPLYVDPDLLYEYFGSDYGRQWDGWGHYASKNSYTGKPWSIWTYGSPANIRNAVDWYSGGEWAQFHWANPRGYIAHMYGRNVSHVTPAATCAYMGILHNSWTSWKGYWDPGCAVAVSGANPLVGSGSDRSYGDFAAVRMSMNGHGSRPWQATLQAYGVEVGVSDNESPTITNPNPNSVPNSTGGAWVRGGQTVTVNPSARDAGLGLWGFNLYLPTGAQTWRHGCSGARSSLCPTGSTTGSFQFNTNILGEGANSIPGAAYDALLKQAGFYTNVRVDKRGPEITLSGALWDARNTTTQAASLAFQADASDPHSGVASVEVLLDGRPVSAAAPDADTRTWAFRPGTCISGSAAGCAKYGSGIHKIKVVATDRLGHSASQEFSMTWAGIYPAS